MTRVMVAQLGARRGVEGMGGTRLIIGVILIGHMNHVSSLATSLSIADFVYYFRL